MLLAATLWMAIAGAMDVPWGWAPHRAPPCNRFEEDRFAGFGAPGLPDFADDPMGNYPGCGPSLGGPARRLPELTHAVSSCHLVAITPESRSRKTTRSASALSKPKRAKRHDDDWEALEDQLWKRKKGSKKGKKSKSDRKSKKSKEIVIPSGTVPLSRTPTSSIAPLPQLASHPPSVYPTQWSAEDRKTKRRLAECQDELSELKDKAARQRKSKLAIADYDHDEEDKEDMEDRDGSKKKSKRDKKKKKRTQRSSKRLRRRDDDDDYDDEDDRDDDDEKAGEVEEKRPKGKKKRFGKLRKLLSRKKGKGKRSRRKADNHDDYDGDRDIDDDRKKSKRVKRMKMAAVATAGTAAVAIPAIIAALQRAQKTKSGGGEATGGAEGGGGIAGKIGGLVGKLFGKKKPAAAEHTAAATASTPSNPDDQEIHVNAPMMDMYNQQQKAALQAEEAARKAKPRPQLDPAESASTSTNVTPSTHVSAEEPQVKSAFAKSSKRLTKKGSSVSALLLDKTPDIDVKVQSVEDAGE